MSVAEAAEVLGVVPQRVRERIREGSLAAQRVGSQWVIDAEDVRRLAHRDRPGRPLSTKSAWDLLAVADRGPAAERLTSSSRSRARSRLRALLAEVGRLVDADRDDSLDRAAAVLGRAMGNRAARACYAASPRDLADLRADSRLRLSGVSAPESNIASGDLAEGYASEEDADGLADGYLLEPVARDRANVILHLVSGDISPDLDLVTPEGGHLNPERASAWLALAADLAEHDGARERGEAVRALAVASALLHRSGFLVAPAATLDHLNRFHEATADLGDEEVMRGAWS
ncbi:helix-turn-helix domain-containing protein [Nocardioides sp. GY 10113]|uniref:helix-turn-helix domain-containing protein n=1 Tax=Nocardioides sp. GY 10113 TaxID=2569761 RepID=UPI0010A7AF64|nr:helix-turn-helix domain-containing protein [Nocardioides sp. GY 10113]TIC82206.1 helix-turn-helix domain-containing protein [Nocardioides sp. GY 10113]